MILMGAHEGTSGEAGKFLDLDGSFKGDLPYITTHKLICSVRFSVSVLVYNIKCLKTKQDQNNPVFLVTYTC